MDAGCPSKSRDSAEFAPISGGNSFHVPERPAGNAGNCFEREGTSHRSRSGRSRRGAQWREQYPRGQGSWANLDCFSPSARRMSPEVPIPRASTWLQGAPSARRADSGSMDRTRGGWGRLRPWHNQRIHGASAGQHWSLSAACWARAGDDRSLWTRRPAALQEPAPEGGRQRVAPSPTAAPSGAERRAAPPPVAGPPAVGTRGPGPPADGSLGRGGGEPGSPLVAGTPGGVKPPAPPARADATQGVGTRAAQQVSTRPPRPGPQGTECSPTRAPRGRPQEGRRPPERPPWSLAVRATSAAAPMTAR